MENERPHHGEQSAAPAQHAHEIEAAHLAPQGDIFIPGAETPNANRVLWEMIAEAMHLRRLTLAEVSRGSGVARQTLIRYREGKGRFVPETVLGGLVAYFTSLPPGEGEPSFPLRWDSTHHARTAIANRVFHPEEVAILHAAILGQEGEGHAMRDDTGDPAH